ncbi:calcium-responsive transcription factor-like [Hydractinia symbiolongicarpus]|uniref:calcium-responsive transcription factor-like n=1 Tax=Hydractinia symbiolongicarpus TaxID=13093 RepID=UPI0025501530|nr:calcium-responsive transcription factor-like [Hydractinia symbiolongicarpus]
MIEFPEYPVVNDTVRNRKKKSADLRTDISSGKQIKQTCKFLVSIPDISSHEGHIVTKDSGITQKIDSEIVSKIDMYVKEGVTDTKDMKRLLKIHVKKEMFKETKLPEPSNKRFYPRNATIRNHVTHIRRKLCHSLIDQECLQKKIKEWTDSDPTTKIYFRPKGLFFVFVCL